LGITAKIGARIVLQPSFGISLEQMKERVKGPVRISKCSSLVLDGDVTLDGLELDGALEVSGSVVVKDKVVKNAGQPLEAIPDAELTACPPSFQIRGYRQGRGEVERLVDRRRPASLIAAGPAIYSTGAPMPYVTSPQAVYSMRSPSGVPVSSMPFPAAVGYASASPAVAAPVVYQCPPEIFAKLASGGALTPEETAQLTGQASPKAAAGAAEVASGVTSPKAVEVTSAEASAPKTSKKKSTKKKDSLNASSRKAKGCC